MSRFLTLGFVLFAAFQDGISVSRYDLISRSVGVARRRLGQLTNSSAKVAGAKKGEQG